MSPNDTHDAVDILIGYEQWRKTQARNSESWEYDPLSVSAYLDALAAQRALDAVQAIEAVYADPELTWQEVDSRIRMILGVEQ